MDNWELFEEEVKKATGGKRTPGSGNKRSKGDIITTNWMIECKQTDQDSMNFEYVWLRKLLFEAQAVGKDPCFVIGFGLIGTPYYFTPVPPISSMSDPKTVQFKKDFLPEFIHTAEGFWEKDTWDSLYELK